MAEHSDENILAAVDTNPQTDQTDSGELSHVERLKQQLHGREKQAKEEARMRKEAEDRATKLRQSLIKTKYNEVYRGNQFDAKKFQELLDEDPEIADEVAQKFELNGSKVSSAKDILEYLGSNQPSQVNEEQLVEKLAKKIKEDLVHDSALKKAKSRFDHLPEDKRDEAQSRFEKITSGRKLTAEEADEFAEMATLYVMKGEILSTNRDKKMASLASLSLGNMSGLNSPQQEDDGISDQDIKDYLLKYSAPSDRGLVNHIYKDI